VNPPTPTRRPWLARLIAAGLAGVLTTSLAGVAQASPTPGPSDPTIGAEWTDPVTHQAWDGTTYTTIDLGFAGNRVVSPGDRVQRTLAITNNGPSAATLTLVLVADQVRPAGSTTSGLARDITLFWDVAGHTGQAVFADLLNAPDGTTLAQLPIARDAGARVTVGFTVAESLTTDDPGSGSSPVLSFDVLAYLRGNTPPPDAQTGGVALPDWAAYGLGLILVGLLVAGVGWAVRRPPRG